MNKYKKKYKNTSVLEDIERNGPVLHQLTLDVPGHIMFSRQLQAFLEQLQEACQLHMTPGSISSMNLS